MEEEKTEEEKMEEEKTEEKMEERIEEEKMEEEGDRDGDKMGTILEEPAFTNTIEVTNPAGMLFNLIVSRY